MNEFEEANRREDSYPTSRSGGRPIYGQNHEQGSADFATAPWAGGYLLKKFNYEKIKNDIDDEIETICDEEGIGSLDFAITGDANLKERLDDVLLGAVHETGLVEGDRIFVSDVSLFCPAEAGDIIHQQDVVMDIDNDEPVGLAEMIFEEARNERFSGFSDRESNDDSLESNDDYPDESFEYVPCLALKLQRLFDDEGREIELIHSFDDIELLLPLSIESAKIAVAATDEKIIKRIADGWDGDNNDEFISFSNLQAYGESDGGYLTARLDDFSQRVQRGEASEEDFYLVGMQLNQHFFVRAKLANPHVRFGVDGYVVEDQNIEDKVCWGKFSGISINDSRQVTLHFSSVVLMPFDSNSRYDEQLYYRIDIPLGSDDTVLLYESHFFPQLSGDDAIQ